MSKDNEMAESFLKSANKRDINLDLKFNKDFLFMLDKGISLVKKEEHYEPIDFIIFWDKDIRLIKNFESYGIKCFNNSYAIECCDDKSLTHQILTSHGIKMPKTIICPKTYFGFTNEDTDFLTDIADILKFPIIVKECFGSFGEQVYFTNNLSELKNIVVEKGKNPLLFQEFLKTSNGRDIRVQIVGGEIVGAVKRFSANGDFRANATAGGKMERITLSQAQEELAVKCCKILNLDFAGVDILYGEDDEPIICEINSNSYVKNFYNATGVDVCDCILNYIQKIVGSTNSVFNHC